MHLSIRALCITTTKNRVALLFLMTTLATVGCGGGGPPSGRIPISGEVSLDGQPLDQGSIQFEPEAGTSKLNSGGVVSNGKYRIDGERGLPPGKYKVRITSVAKDTRSAQEIMDNPGAPPAERIAAKFNTESNEVVEVSKGGKNQFDFKTESAKP